MDDDVKGFAAKFIETTGRWADAELLGDDEVWAFMREFFDEYAQRKARLTDGQLSLLRTLGAAMGIPPGAPLAHYAPAFERNFGPGPLPQEKLIALTRYLHAQVNGAGAFETVRKPKVDLKAGLPVPQAPPPKRRR